jgi:hypothetical protein
MRRSRRDMSSTGKSLLGRGKLPVYAAFSY